jgi:hypothetical protein
MASAGLPKLCDAYRDGLIKVTGKTQASLNMLPERIKITLADNNSVPFAALVDAMNLRAMSFTDAKVSPDTDVVAAAKEVSKFVFDVTGQMPADDKVSLNTDLPRMKAVIAESQTKKDDIVETLLIGVSRSIAMRAGYLARAISARFRPRVL